MRILIALLFTCLSYGQIPDLLQASIQQASGGSDAILAVSPVIYLNNTTIDATATGEGDPVTEWTDLSGNGYDANSVVNPELHLEGSDRQVTFNGSDDWMTITNDTDFDFTPGTDEFTIIFRLGENAASAGYAFGKANASTGSREYVLVLSSSETRYYIGGTQAAASGYPPANALLIAVIDTGGISVWQDGSLIINDATIGTGTTTGGTDLNIGTRSDGSGTIWNGDLDLFAVIPTAISTGERTAIEAQFQVN